MEPLLVAADADGGVEELAEPGRGKQFVTGTVGNDAAGTHENDALDFREDVAEMMGDKDQAGALGSETAQGFAEFALGGEVEGVGWLVEQELAGPVDEGAGDEDAALFAG